MTKLNELKAAYEAATPGEWSVDSETHVTKWDFGKERCGCRSVAQTGHGLPTRQSDENIANAQFIALAHNNMPALLEAVEALEKMKASFEDLLNGYPERELHEPYQVTLNRANSILEKLN